MYIFELKVTYYAMILMFFRGDSTRGRQLR